MLRMLLVLLSIAATQIEAETLANFRGNFPVIEVDIREVIAKRLHQMQASGELERRKEAMIAGVRSQILRPKPLALKTTSSPQTFLLDPSVTLSRDIVGAHGELIAAKGQKINPFQRVAFKKTLIFFNGDDARQVAWVASHSKAYPKVKYILTGGSTGEMSRRFGRVYFDLKGRLSARFQLRHVPSMVSQSGLQWQIEVNVRRTTVLRYSLQICGSNRV